MHQQTATGSITVGKAWCKRPQPVQQGDRAMSNSRSGSRVLKIEPATVKVGGNTYHQFTYQHAIWGTVYLLLKGMMEPSFMALFQDAEVMSVMSLAFHNNAMDIRSKEVSQLWKGRALALELHNRGYHMMRFGQEHERGMTLMEVGDWIMSGTFVGMRHYPFIEDGMLNVLP